MASCLMTFRKTDPTWLRLKIPVQVRHKLHRVSSIVIKQMNPIKSEEQQMEHIVAKIEGFKTVSTSY